MDYSFDLQAEHGDRFPSACELGIARQEGYRAADIRSNPIRGLRRVSNAKTHIEYNKSALPLIADMRADMDFRRSGPGGDITTRAITAFGQLV